MSELPPVSSGTALLVIAVAYGDPRLLDRSLAALNGRYATVVVDNSSSPAARAVASRHGASYVDPGANLGFAAAVNRGLAVRSAGADVLLLNPDAVVAGDDVARIQRALHGSSRAACAAPAQHAPGTEVLDRVCWPLPSPARAWLEAVGLARLGRQCEFLIGSVLMLRGDAIDDVGGFDEGFFLYAEEADWQLRARRRGWEVHYCPEIVAEHIGAATSADLEVRERRFHTSQARFVRKWYGSLGWQSYRLAQIAGATSRALLRRGQPRGTDARRALLYIRDPLRSSGSLPTGGASAAAAVAPVRVTDPAERRLRVVHVVCTGAFAGVERYVVSAATGLALLGCDVVVIGGDRRQMPRELSPAGVTWYRGPTVAAAAARLALLGRCDVVHAHMTKAELASALALVRNRAPIVTTRHFAATRGSSVLARALGRVLTRVTGAQLAISEFVAERIEGTSVVVQPGVHPVEEVVPDGAREPVVLMLQRLEREKHVEIGIEAFARSGLAAQGWRLLIAGDGAMAGQLREQARGAGLDGACELLGARSDVGALYRRASIFLATRPDEPYGLSVVEAMAWGLPVLAAGAGGHLETVGRCGGAALYAPDDPDDAAERLAELAGDAPRHAAYGAALRTLQREQFDVGRQVEETLAVYRALCDKDGAR